MYYSVGTVTGAAEDLVVNEGTEYGKESIYYITKLSVLITAEH
jgi:uncharacterized protein YheU (UPF0270 family)